ncbi:nucleolar protein 3-like [Mauremys reevesii]|uniref:nucleolar protein 3-like n=1 Tax=Mauremys reevesii TaxID=260615 RepID=UPI00193F9E66|nr:nucleolar protein 3-like [Mauremys reevesii]
MGDLGLLAFETISQGREQLITLLLTPTNPILDEVASLGIVTEEEYEALEKLAEPRERIRRLLIKIQRKGERGCEQFLECLQSLCPDFPPDLQPPGHREACADPGAHRARAALGKHWGWQGDRENPETALPHEENDQGNPDCRPSSGDIDSQNSEDATSSEKNDPEKPEEPEKP